MISGGGRGRAAGGPRLAAGGTRPAVAAAAILALLAGIQLLACPGHYLGLEHDDVQYLLAALSLLRGGYGLGISPGDPPLTFVTPGWPVLLVPAAALSGESPAGYQLWSWAWLVACDVLVWAWVRRRAGPAAALAVTAAFALNPFVLSRSGVVMSEVPALALGVALLLAAERPGLPAWAEGLGLGFLWLVRPGAVALWPALWVGHWRARRWRSLAVSAACALAPVAAWRLWVGAEGGRLAEAGELALALPGRTAGELAALGAGNLAAAIELWGASSLPWRSEGSLVWGLALAGLAVRGVFLQLRRGESSGPVLLASGAALHALWPYWYERYLLLFLPFLLLCVWRALDDAAGAWLRRGREAAAALLVLLAAGPFAAQGLPRLRGGEERGRTELERAYAWIRANTAPGDLLASAFYARDAFYTGRAFVPLPEGPWPEALRRGRVRYVLWQRTPDLGSSLGRDFHWQRLLAQRGEELRRAPFRPVVALEAEGAAIYGLD